MYEQLGSRSPCWRSSSSARVAPLRSPATSASASVHTLRSAEPAQDSWTSSTPIAVPGRAPARASPARAAAAAGGRRPGRSARGRPGCRARARARRRAAPSQRGSSRGLTWLSSAIWPPASSTALTSAAGTLQRPSSRAKNATVASRRRSRPSRVDHGSTSASFQRSTPSAITNRRPMRERHRRQRAGDRLRRAGVALEDLDARRPLSASAMARRRARRSAIRPWSSPWIR